MDNASLADMHGLGLGWRHQARFTGGQGKRVDLERHLLRLEEYCDDPPIQAYFIRTDY
jgi:hypothetical protein